MRITVIGGANVDIFTKSRGQIIHGDSNPALVTMAPGGVGRNIAENLARLGATVHFITAIGEDPLGGYLREECGRWGIHTDTWVVRREMNTGVYMAALDHDGELYVAFNAMTVLESLKAEDLEPYRGIMRQSDLLVVDANLTEEAIEAVFAMGGGVPVMVDTVSVAKAPRIARLLSQTSILKTNRMEAAVFTGFPLDTQEDIRRACSVLLSQGVGRVFITLGAAGTWAADRDRVEFTPALPVVVKNVTGAGDAFSAGIALYARHNILAQAKFGAACAALTLEADEPVSPVLTRRAAENLL